MRYIVFIALFGIVSSVQASFFGGAKSGADKDGNCLPEVVVEYSKLYGQIDELDKVATRCEAQLKSPIKESQKLGLNGLKELSGKAKAARKAFKQYSDTYKGTQCKAELANHGKTEKIIFNVNERAADLDKSAAQYEEYADRFLKTPGKP